MSNSTKTRVRLIHDNNAESPREWDNISTMYCWHRRYNLGDEQPRLDPEEWLTQLIGEYGLTDYPEEINEENRRRILEKHIPVFLPLYLFDHSGISISVSEFGCPWDSGMVGYVIVDRETIRKEYGEVTPETIEIAKKVAIGEVEVYDQFLRGDTFGFIIEESECCECCGHEDWEEVNSCWGFYGSDVTENGMMDHMQTDEQKDALQAADIEYM